MGQLWTPSVLWFLPACNAYAKSPGVAPSRNPSLPTNLLTETPTPPWRSLRRPSPSKTEAPLALLVAADRPQEVDPAEGGPVGVAEVVFAVGALPQEEAAEAELPAGPDDQVGVRQFVGVEVLADQIGRDLLGQRDEVLTLGGALPHEGGHGVGDLLPAAVAHGHVQEDVLVVAGGLLGHADRLAGGGGQHLEAADGPDAQLLPVDLRVHRGLAELALDEAQQGVQLLRRPRKVFGGEDPDRHHPDPQLLAPAQDLLH